MTNVHAINRAELAEYAEVVGTDTDMVLGVLIRPESPGAFVVFSPDREHPEELFSVRLERDEDGVLRQVGVAKRFEL